MQDELSLGFPLDIVEDLFDPVSYYNVSCMFYCLHTSMTKQEGKLWSKIQAALHTTTYIELKPRHGTQEDDDPGACDSNSLLGET